MRGLLLNHECHMWHGVLQKTKTQTRRNSTALTEVNNDPDNYKLEITEFKDGKLHAWFKHPTTGKLNLSKSRHAVNDIVYLQEPTLNLCPHVTDTDSFCYQYPDINGNTDLDAFKALIEAAIKKGAEWDNKYFMPEKLARYHVQITNIKIERLADISAEDCFLEGIKKIDHPYSRPTIEKGGVRNTNVQHSTQYYYTHNNVKVFFNTAQEAYFSLLKKVGTTTDHPNPWLFAYDFKLVKI